MRATKTTYAAATYLPASSRGRAGISIQVADGAPDGTPRATREPDGAACVSPSSARRSRDSLAEADFAASSKRTRVAQSSAIPARQTRKVKSIDPGSPPSAVANTRGWTSDSASRTEAKLSGTKAPAVIANTDA